MSYHGTRTRYRDSRIKRGECKSQLAGNRHMESPSPQRRFRSAAKYYLLGRPSYSSLLIRRVVELCALNNTHKILDLGSGPGQLAMAFAPFVREVTALDPEPEMLEIARKSASTGHFNIKFVQGSSFDL